MLHWSGVALGREETTAAIGRKDETEDALLRCHKSAPAQGF